MLESLRRHAPNSRTAVFCFDDTALKVLQSLGWDTVVPVSLAELEKAAPLSKVKSDRNPKEYCWTSTSFTLAHCLERLGFPSCTYLDADLFFFSDPAEIFREAPEASVLLTEHRYTPRFDHSAISGKYCVQFVGFRNHEPGLEALHWWQNACIDWCYDRVEPGRFGDQKYLDDWLQRFRGVHEVQHQGAGVAPWNVQRYKIRPGPHGPLVQAGGKEWPVIFYHFHALRLFKNGMVDLCHYPLPKEASLIYDPYLARLRYWEEKLRADFQFQAARQDFPSWIAVAKRILKGTENYREFESR